MFKKALILTIVILLLCGGGFFYLWWNGHADERALNKTLPEGVRVDKCLLTGEWRVVNKIDGYEFKVPKEWKGVKEIEYIPEREEEEFKGTSINTEGLDGESRSMAIDRFEVKEEASLEDWAQKLFNTYGLVGNFIQDKVGDIDAVKTQENVHLVGMHVYFFNKSPIIYAITCGSEEFIRDIILNGKW